MTGSVVTISSESEERTSEVEYALQPDLPSSHGFQVSIESTLDYEDFILYVIRVSYKFASWTVRRRYKEFAELHTSLAKLYSGPQYMFAFPGKKLLGNFRDKFVQKRQKKLEEYLRNAMSNLQAIPKELAYFLDMHKYELNWIVHTMAEDIFNRCEAQLFLPRLIPEQYKTYQLDTLQLHAIYKRMNLELLPDEYEMTEASVNLAHLMDFAFNLRVMKVEGRNHRAGTSDWRLNHIPISLSYFKSMKHLQLDCVNVQMLDEASFETIQHSLVNLHCHKSVNSCTQILNPLQLSNRPVWYNLIRLNLSRNRLTNIDESMCCVPRLQFLDLSHNHLFCIQNLSALSQLRELDLSYNNFSCLEDVHAKLGNIKKLNLDNNKLFSLDGLSKMYSLEQLSCTGNRLCEVSDVEGISFLPCLEYLWLKDNPLCSVLDYRTKVLEIFSDRAPEVTLDGIPTTNRELNTVRMLVALQKAKVQIPRCSVMARATLALGCADLLNASASSTAGGSRQRSSSLCRTLSREQVREMMEAEEAEKCKEAENHENVLETEMQAKTDEQQFEFEGENGLTMDAIGDEPDTENEINGDASTAHGSKEAYYCKAVKQVKSDLVMGLTGEVNMIDWSSLMSEQNLLLPQNDFSHEDKISREKERDCLRSLVSFLSSNISSRSDCTQLFSFIVKREDEKHEQLYQTEDFLQLMKDFVLKGASFEYASGVGSFHDPFDTRGVTNAQLVDSGVMLVHEEGYPNFVLWEHVSKSNKSALSTLPLPNALRALASCDPRKFINTFHDVLIGRPQEKEMITYTLWCYVQTYLMPFPKLAIVFITTNQCLRVFFDKSNSSSTKFFNESSSEGTTESSARMSKRKSLLAGRNMVPIEDLVANLTLTLTLSFDQITGLNVNPTSHCVEVPYTDTAEDDGGGEMVTRSMVVATLDAPDMQSFSGVFKNVPVNCPLNLMDLKDSIFNTQKQAQEQQSSTNVTLSPKKTADSNSRIFYASNLMKLTINDVTQSTFPLLMLTDHYICCIHDPTVDAVTNWKTENSPNCAGSSKSSGSSKNPLICVHKISHVLILKLMKHSTSVSLSVRTLAQSLEDLSNSLELNFEEEFYDSSEESKDLSSLPISYLTFSFRTMTAKERFVFLLQKRFDDLVKRRLSIISS